MAELVQLKQISGLVGQSTLSFATPQALAAADMSGVPDMTMVYVGTVEHRRAHVYAGGYHDDDRAGRGLVATGERGAREQCQGPPDPEPKPPNPAEVSAETPRTPSR